jgi:hypothetical protein
MDWKMKVGKQILYPDEIGYRFSGLEVGPMSVSIKKM